MTLVTRNSHQWNALPGWGIAADLTPPELLTARRRRRQRKFVAAALAAVLVLCGAGYVWTVHQRSAARDALAAARDETTALQAKAHMYADVTQIETKVAQIDKQLAVVLATDVDFTAVLRTFRNELPGSMTIKTASLALATGTAAGQTTSAGHAVIGTVILGGSALTYVDVSHYVDALSATTGVVDVVPTSAQADRNGVQYNVTLNITDQLLSHRFDRGTATTGGK